MGCRRAWAVPENGGPRGFPPYIFALHFRLLPADAGGAPLERGHARGPASELPSMGSRTLYPIPGAWRCLGQWGRRRAGHSGRGKAATRAGGRNARWKSRRWRADTRVLRSRPCSKSRRAARAKARASQRRMHFWIAAGASPDRQCWARTFRTRSNSRSCRFRVRQQRKGGWHRGGALVRGRINPQFQRDRVSGTESRLARFWAPLPPPGARGPKRVLPRHGSPWGNPLAVT